MSFQKFKLVSYCVGGRHRSATINIDGDITSKGSKVIIGHCLICNRKQISDSSDNTIPAEGLDDFFKNLGEKVPNILKEMAKSVLKNPG